MIRRFAVAAFLIACVLCLSSSLALAAEDVLKLVPDAASGFLLINQPGATDAKLQGLAREMAIPLPPPLMMLKMQSGIKEGMDEKGTIAVVVLPPDTEGALPTPIVLIPVTDFAKFIQPFEPQQGADDAAIQVTIMRTQFWARSIGGYAAITDNSHRELLTKTLKLSQEIPAALAPWRQWLADNDVAGVILPPGIKRLATKAREALQRTKSSMEQLGENMKPAVAGFDIYDKIIQAVAGEVSAHGIGLQIDKQNTLRITSRTSLVAGGTFADLLAQVHPAKENPLNGLPNGPYVVTGGGVVSGPMWNAMLKASAEMTKTMTKATGLSDEQIDKLPKFSFEGMQGVRAMSISLGVGKSGESIYANMITVMRVDDAKAFMAAYEKDMKQYGEYLKAAKLPMVQPMEVEVSEIGGTPALQITMKAPTFPEGQQPPQTAQMMESFFGPGGKVVGWIVPTGKHNVVMGFVNKDLLQQTIEAVKQGKPGLADNAEIAKTAALLPPDALTVVYLSPQGTIEFVTRILTAILPPTGDVNLPEFPATPPLGYAITAAPNELQTSLVVPVEVLRAVMPYAGKVQAMRSGATTTSPTAPGAGPAAPAKKL